ncbi:MAG: DUF5615 family PIN-like protein [Chloroflexota bacterium]
MKLFADECVYHITVKALRSWGHDVVTTQELNLVGKADKLQLEAAISQGRVLITNDLDFSNIRRYPPAHHSGIVVLKIRPRVLNQVHTVLKRLLDSTSQESLQQTLVIVDRNKYRLRQG